MDGLLATRTLTRRQVLRFLGAMGFVGWLGRWREGLAAIAPQLPHSPSSTPSQSAIAAMPTCIVRPQQTEGPYFVDEKLNRSDIRSDPTDGLLKSGVPLKLTFQVSQIGANSCVPLKGAVVDIWHCDAQGIYSDVRDRTFNTTGKKFLRGYQITNALGLAEFTTIYPGWYPGRAVHIHFKIRTSTPSQGIHEFTSQLYFEDTLTDQIHAQSPYAAIGRRNVRNNQDGIFQQGGKNLMLKFVKNAKFYAARFDIGLQI